MSRIDIQHPHSKTPAQAREAVEAIAGKLSDRFGVDCRWEGDTLHFNRTGVEGRIALLPDALRVSADLGFLLAAMKGPIEAEIRRILGERFG
ncbi:polyhydroxyalkanoic acid system family protein [Pseudoxanthomonas mexicana]|uniref:polyhydroxyalkanoic acid system family protein n=1 Tax=Pseudoxanthomonas mexicana TaxID=128785 RepID=UPI00398AC131